MRRPGWRRLIPWVLLAAGTLAAGLLLGDFVLGTVVIAVAYGLSWNRRPHRRRR